MKSFRLRPRRREGILGLIDFLGSDVTCLACGSTGAKKFMSIVRCPNPSCINGGAAVKPKAAATLPPAASSPQEESPPPSAQDFDPGADAVQVRYRNYRGDERSFTGDRRTLDDRGRHVSLCVAPSGRRIALAKERIQNLPDVEALLAARTRTQGPRPTPRESQILGYHRRHGSTSPAYEEILSRHPDWRDAAGFPPGASTSRPAAESRPRRSPRSPIQLIAFTVWVLFAVILNFYKRHASTGRSSFARTPRTRNATSPQDAKSRTPLMRAAAQGRADAVQSLLASGADVNAKDADGATALVLAIDDGYPSNDYIEIVKALIARGADAAARKNDGSTALMEAAARDRVEIAMLLIADGADVDAKNDMGETALMRAARADRAEMVRVLVARGAKVDARQIRGATALMLAAANGGVDAVRALVDQGADVHARENDGLSVADLTCKSWANRALPCPKQGILDLLAGARR